MKDVSNSINNSNTILKCALEMSNKPNKIWLKGLNPRIPKDEGLNWSKVSKWTNSKIHWKLRDQKHI